MITVINCQWSHDGEPIQLVPNHILRPGGSGLLQLSHCAVSMHSAQKPRPLSTHAVCGGLKPILFATTQLHYVVSKRLKPIPRPTKMLAIPSTRTFEDKQRQTCIIFCNGCFPLVQWGVTVNKWHHDAHTVFGMLR